MKWVYNDGGRAAAGIQVNAKRTSDCVVRAIAIATGIAYTDVARAINLHALRERPGAKRRKGRRSDAQSGVFKATYHRYLTALGWQWTPTMHIGSGCTVHLREGELPPGRLVVSVTRHLVAVIDGVAYDTGNPTRGGMRCVYGYYSKGN